MKYFIDLRITSFAQIWIASFNLMLEYFRCIKVLIEKLTQISTLNVYYN